jgi:hypothetical protein
MRIRIFVILGLAICGAATKATAQNLTCVKPWAIPDKWIDNHDDPNDHVWTADDTFERVDSHGNPLSDPDVYVDSAGYPDNTGFNVERDLGLLLTLKIGDPNEGMRPGWFYPIDVANAGGGGSAYRTAIATCQETRPLFFGDVLQPLSGNLNGPTVQGVADLINLDPNAEWDPVGRAVINSCAPSPSCGSVSPRIVPIVAFNPIMFEESLKNGHPSLVITNIIGVFIDGIVGGKITGYLTALPGMSNPLP